jgi:hypothetical protein
VSYPISTVRNVSTVGAGSVAPGNVGRYAFAVATGGLVVADASTGLPLPDGKNLPVTVSSQIPKATVAGALGRFARKAIPLVGTGVALYDLGQELGFGLDNSSGTMQVTKVSDRPAGCGSPTGTALAIISGSAGTNCHGQPTAGFVIDGFERSGSQCRLYYHCGNGTYLGAYTSWSANSDPQGTQPSTIQEFEDAIESRGSWPPSSALARAMRDAINAGEIVPVHPHDVTGPASTPGPVTTTTDSVNNTTTTSTTTHNHTYDGPNVTTTTTTTNVTVDNTTNNIISSTTSTTQPVMPESSSEDEPVTFSDTALPPLPKLYEPKYPDGLVGVWNSKKAQLDSAPLVALVGDLMPNIGSGGTCPVWTMPLDFGFFNAGVLDFSVPCFIWDFAKVVIIVSALLLARRLVFGG